MNLLKSLSLASLLSLGCLPGHSEAQQAAPQPPIPADPAIESRITELMKDMSLEVKAGQMAQYTLDVLCKGDNVFSSYEPFELDEAMVNKVLKELKAGSILNTANNRARTTEEWNKVITELQKAALEATGIPLLYGIDSNHGATYTAGATFYPQEIGMAATFAPELMRQAAEMSAYETRASQIPWTFNPTMDLGRDARWPRQWESFGEDPYLNARMAVAATLGYQGDDPDKIDPYHIAACLKHYLGYGVPATGKDRTPAVISPSELREKFFEPFRAAVVEGKALSVMVNSGIINGVSTHADKKLLDGWLKKELAFDGVIVTDWADMPNLLNRDRVAADYREALALTINAGVDMIMEPYNVEMVPALISAVKDGLIPMERIDDAVRRILRMKIRLGLFDKPITKPEDYPAFASPAHEALALRAAEESITLLKNEEGLLPLRKGVKILISGPNGDSMRTLDGGWSYSWQGEKTEEFAGKYRTIYEAVAGEFGAENVTFVPGVTYKMDGEYWEENEPDIDAAVRAASSADVILLCIGENSYCETPGNLDELSLSPNQLALAKALEATGKPVILVLNEGRPRLIRTIEPDAKAVIQLYLPGNYGGDALARILSGKVNPSGKLPYTYPKYEQALLTYDHKPSQNLDGKMEGAYDYGANTSVQYPFGFGLSYTRFAYSDLSVDKSAFAPGDLLSISVTVTNTGDRAGKETVLLFSSDLTASMTPDVRRLRAFEKVELRPGESRTVTFALPSGDLAFVNADGKWTLEKGDFNLRIGDQMTIVRCTETKVWETPNK